MQDIVLTHSKPVGELRRRQPFVVIRRLGILQLGQQVVEVGLLCSGRTESDRHAMQNHGAVGTAYLETGLSKTMHVPREWHFLSRIDGTSEPVRLCGQAQS